MANIKVSELPSASSFEDNDYTMIVQSGENKKITKENLLKDINSNLTQIPITSVSVTDTNVEQIIGTYTVNEDGIYLLAGNILTNLWGETGRMLQINIKVNDYFVSYYPIVINENAYSFPVSISSIISVAKNDIITISVSNSISGKKWAIEGNTINILKLK